MDLLQANRVRLPPYHRTLQKVLCLAGFSMSVNTIHLQTVGLEEGYVRGSVEEEDEDERAADI